MADSSPSMMAVPPRQAASAGSWRARWLALAPRERIGLLVALSVVGLYLILAVGVFPALRTLREVPPQRAEAQALQQKMLAQAAEAQGLRAQPPVAPEVARAALQAAAQRLDGRGTLTLQGPDRATLQCRGIGGAALMGFVSEARAGARARVLEVQLTAAGPGVWDGQLLLSLGAPG